MAVIKTSGGTIKTSGGTIVTSGGIIGFQPIVNGILTFPSNAFYLQPNVQGNFTKAMIETAVTNGEKYIVFDAETLDIHYEESPHLVNNNAWDAYLNLTLLGTELNPVTLDFRKVFINCFPNASDNLRGHRVFNFDSSENVILKFGNVEGDKFKRPLTTNDETVLENTQLVESNRGTQKLTIDGGNTAGFMADVSAVLPFGTSAIDTDPLGLAYFLQPNGRYESKFYNVNSIANSDFGLTGGLGYNRLLYYDMEDVIFKFYDINETLISEITQAKFYQIYQFPANTSKIKVNVNPLDGRIESPTNFGHNLQYKPNFGMILKNLKISDNHRGGIANIGAFASIDNVEFFNTQRYFDAPKFGVNGIQNSTTYHVNCEDVTSRGLTIQNCSFRDKFHAILITHGISTDMLNNTFTGNDEYNIFVYDLLYGTTSGNVFNGIVNLGNGNNKSNILVTQNTGSPDIRLSNGAEWTNNTFVGGRVRLKGKFNNNILTNYNYPNLDFTKEIHSNIFIGKGNLTPFMNVGSYVFNNEFRGCDFRIQSGTHVSAPIIWDSVTVDNSSNPSLFAIDRSLAATTAIVINSTFISPKIRQQSVNEGVNYIHGSWYFENTDFEDIIDYFIISGSNENNNNPVKFFFKNCTFTGTGNFISNTIYGGMNYEITLDNCTVANTITLPNGIINSTVTMPTIVEPRTQNTPVITYNVDRTEVNALYHLYTLKIRNKNTLSIIFDKDASGTYLHYNNTPNDFEYSIDGGLYWDSVNA